MPKLLVQNSDGRCLQRKLQNKGVKLTTGELIHADTVIISIGDAPDLEFLPKNIKTEQGFIVVNDYYQTTDPKIFAIGDAVKPGLLTDSIGSGRKAAKAIINILKGEKPLDDTREMIHRERITLEYFDPRITGFDDIEQCSSQCSSCGTCRDCGICVEVCPQAAISRKEKETEKRRNGETGKQGNKDDFEYIVDETRCIGCGFCAKACPCGIWNIIENEPIE